MLRSPPSRHMEALGWFSATSTASLRHLRGVMGPTLKAAGAVIIEPPTPTHFPGGDLAPATIDYALVDDRIANSRVIKSIEIDTDLSIGKHRAVRVNVSNKGHVCYVTRILKPRAFPRKIPMGCVRKPVATSSTLDEVGTDKFYADTLACAETELAR